eukprot:scaffold40063_cov17-Tisochrysis_lutea.AAC.2
MSALLCAHARTAALAALVWGREDLKLAGNMPGGCEAAIQLLAAERLADIGKEHDSRPGTFEAAVHTLRCRTPCSMAFPVQAECAKDEQHPFHCSSRGYQRWAARLSQIKWRLLKMSTATQQFPFLPCPKSKLFEEKKLKQYVVIQFHFSARLRLCCNLTCAAYYQ